jgi:peptidoglycan/LPS O-acetylase OafA/YrhL
MACPAHRSRVTAFLNPYRRITSTGRFIPEVDGLRFIAIFLVFVYHLGGDISRHSSAAVVQSMETDWVVLLTRGFNVGVPLFFAISGFILSLPFAEAYRERRAPVSLGSYFLRRLTRLEPPYLIALLLLFVLKIATSRGTASGLLPSLLASSVYTHNAFFGRASDINIVAWSLEIEVQFYILAPLLATVFLIGRDSMRRAVLATAILLTTGLSRLAWLHAPLQFSLLAYAQFFLAGFVVTEFYLESRTRTRRWHWDCGWAAAWVALLGCRVFGGDAYEWVQPWLIVLLFICAILGVAANRLITNQWIVTIGGMCYSIYLLHNYVIAAAGFVTEPLGQSAAFPVRLLVQIAVMSPIVLVVGALYFRLVERHFMSPDWLSQWSSRSGGLVPLRLFVRAGRDMFTEKT